MRTLGPCAPLTSLWGDAVNTAARMESHGVGWAIYSLSVITHISGPLLHGFRKWFDGFPNR